MARFILLSLCVLSAFSSAWAQEMPQAEVTNESASMDKTSWQPQYEVEIAADARPLLLQIEIAADVCAQKPGPDSAAFAYCQDAQRASQPTPLRLAALAAEFTTDITSNWLLGLASVFLLSPQGLSEKSALELYQEARSLQVPAEQALVYAVALRSLRAVLLDDPNLTLEERVPDLASIRIIPLYGTDLQTLALNEDFATVSQSDTQQKALLLGSPLLTSLTKAILEPYKSEISEQASVPSFLLDADVQIESTALASSGLAEMAVPQVATLKIRVPFPVGLTAVPESL